MNQKAMRTMAALLLAAFTHTLPLPLTAAAAETGPDSLPGATTPARDPKAETPD